MSALSMRQAAREVGYSYERFRKIWPELVQTVALPRPLVDPAAKRSRITWDEGAMGEWKAARSRGLVTTPPPANDRRPPTLPGSGLGGGAVARQRAAARELMRRNRS